MNSKLHIVNRMPLNVDIELTSKCDRNCYKCPYYGKDAKYPVEHPEHMTLPLFKKIIDECIKKKVYAIKLNFRGEPLLYPNLLEAVFYAKNRGIKEVRINTNGFYLKGVLMTRLLLLQPNMIILSDYNFKEQFKNGKAFYDAKRIMRFKNVKFVVKTDNPEKWQGIADEILPHKYYDYNSSFENYTESNFECEQPWQRLVVLANGDVKYCSCGVVIPEMILGNLENFTIESLWKSEKMRYVRWCHQHHKTELLEGCRWCPVRAEFIENKNFFVMEWNEK